MNGCRDGFRRAARLDSHGWPRPRANATRREQTPECRSRRSAAFALVQLNV